MEVSEQWLKAKHNAAREEAALDLSIKVVRRFERNGLWRDYGYEATPLTQDAEDADDEEKENTKFAVETSTLELSLDSVGYVAMNLSSDG